MTAKKAIAAALLKYDDNGSVRELATRTYQAGRIAGLREASRWVESECIDRTDGTYVMLTELSRAIRTYANILVKKARAAK